VDEVDGLGRGAGLGHGVKGSDGSDGSDRAAGVLSAGVFSAEGGIEQRVLKRGRKGFACKGLRPALAGRLRGAWRAAPRSGFPGFPKRRRRRGVSPGNGCVCECRAWILHQGRTEQSARCGALRGPLSDSTGKECHGEDRRHSRFHAH